MQDEDYLSKQIITYLGNKRRLLPHIKPFIEHVQEEQNKTKIIAADLFSGSSIVSRLLKLYSEYIVANDMAQYASVLALCYLWNKNEEILSFLQERINYWNNIVLDAGFDTGFIEELYAPKDEANITPDDRVFYTKENARRIDNYRRLFNNFSYEIQCLLLGPLLYKASKHVNTAGKFNGFYKDKNTGRGQYGGTHQQDLRRIKGTITLEVPVLSKHTCNYTVYQEDANLLIRELDYLRDFDLVYIDPPYNNVSYTDTYFMLDLICSYQRPEQITPTLGKPVQLKKSHYNNRKEAKLAFTDLVSNIRSKYLLVSFNNTGFLTKEDIVHILEKVGTVYVTDIPYYRYAGGGRKRKEPNDTRIIEHLYFVKIR